LTVCENSIFRAFFGYSKRKKNYFRRQSIENHYL